MLLCVNVAAAQPLTEYRWKHRLLIVFAENDENPRVAGFRKDLSDATCELENRDVIVGWFFENDLPGLATEFLMTIRHSRYGTTCSPMSAR
jgi:hypothetical protein